MEALSAGDVALRIGLSVLIGLVLGFERERHGRAAGIRTTMLVCVSAAVAMVLSEHLYWEASQGSGSWRPDPARLAAGVLAGMGFLGAGVIIRQDNAIYGVTTAAVLWFSAILGMAIGSGYLTLGFAGFGIAFIALFVLPSAEAFVPADRYALLTVLADLKGPSQGEVREKVQALPVKIRLKPSSLEYDNPARLKTMKFEVKIKNLQQVEAQARTVELVAKLKGVKKVLWS